jgi:hypothetical protein
VVKNESNLGVPLPEGCKDRAAPDSRACDVLAVMDSLAKRAYGVSNFPLAAEIEQSRAALAELFAYADSALSYVDAAADAERARHERNGAPKSQVVAQTVADGLRAALVRTGGVA